MQYTPEEIEQIIKKMSDRERSALSHKLKAIFNGFNDPKLWEGTTVDMSKIQGYYYNGQMPSGAELLDICRLKNVNPMWLLGHTFETESHPVRLMTFGDFFALYKGGADYNINYKQKNGEERFLFVPAEMKKYPQFLRTGLVTGFEVDAETFREEGRSVLVVDIEENFTEGILGEFPVADGVTFSVECGDFHPEGRAVDNAEDAIYISATIDGNVFDLAAVRTDGNHIGVLLWDDKYSEDYSKKIALPSIRELRKVIKESEEE